MPPPPATFIPFFVLAGSFVQRSGRVFYSSIPSQTVDICPPRLLLPVCFTTSLTSIYFMLCVSSLQDAIKGKEVLSVPPSSFAKGLVDCLPLISPPLLFRSLAHNCVPFCDPFLSWPGIASSARVPYFRQVFRCEVSPRRPFLSFSHSN